MPKMLPEMRRLSTFLATHPLTREHRLSAALRVMRWQLVSWLRQEVIVEWAGGARLAARRGMTGATGNIYAGLHEFADMAFALHLLRPGDLFADVGANVGCYTVLASRIVGCQSIAFEPDPSTAAALRRNIELNGIADRVEVRVNVVGEHCGKVRFTIGLDTVNHVLDPTDTSGREVPAETLDCALFERGYVPTLMKVDVEGYEPEVFRGARSVLTAPKLKAVLTENRSSPVVELLKDAGMTEYSYDVFGRRLARPEYVTMANALFVRDPNEVTKRIASAEPVRILGQMV